MQLGKDIAGVVTGGASGLGAATARALAAKGLKVAILDLNAEAGEKLAKELGGTFAKCDVTNEASVDAALAAARKAHGQERILVNCAGIGVAKRITRRVKETNAIEPHDLATFTPLPASALAVAAPRPDAPPVTTPAMSLPSCMLLPFVQHRNYGCRH